MRDDLKEYMMFAHAGSKNHGCEAIVRSTIGLLGKDHSYSLYSKNIAEDIEYGLNNIAKLESNPKTTVTSYNSFKGYVYRTKARLLKTEFDILDCLGRNNRFHKKNAIALSIGGDNYCYGGIISELRDNLTALNHWGIPSVLWGCSVSSKHMSNKVINDLKSYNLITVRESVSQQILEENHANNNIILCCDPAFHLEMQHTPLPAINDNPTIGINVSAFMGYYEAYPNATLLNFEKLVEYILKETEYNVALIPHVVHDSDNNDLIPIRKIKDSIKSPRLYVVDDVLNCMQLKSLISQCKLFIGCRTHATIAAYSTSVPALVAGYSEKAIGIARDLFGEETGLVLPVQNFKNDNSLLMAFCTFLERESELRDRLIAFIPEYKQRIKPAVNAVKKIEEEMA